MPSNKIEKPGKPAQNEDALAVRLSRNIAGRRRELDLTQAQLAERLGVDTETLSRFERGKHLPSLATLERLAAQLQTTVAVLLEEATPQANDDALAMTAWLMRLDEDDRAFVRDQLKRTCDYLEGRHPQD